MFKGIKKFVILEKEWTDSSGEFNTDFEIKEKCYC